MQQATANRRKHVKVVFPFMDCDGHQVASERRSGKERRKSRRGFTDVARKILNLLN